MFMPISTFQINAGFGLTALLPDPSGVNLHPLKLPRDANKVAVDRSISPSSVDTALSPRRAMSTRQ